MEISTIIGSLLAKIIIIIIINKITKTIKKKSSLFPFANGAESTFPCGFSTLSYSMLCF